MKVERTVYKDTSTHVTIALHNNGVLDLLPMCSKVNLCTFMLCRATIFTEAHLGPIKK